MSKLQERNDVHLICPVGVNGRPAWLGIANTGSVHPWAVFTAYTLDSDEWASATHCGSMPDALRLLASKIDSLS